MHSDEYSKLLKSLIAGFLQVRENWKKVGEFDWSGKVCENPGSRGNENFCQIVG